jgi:hypothetical protein
MGNIEVLFRRKAVKGSGQVGADSLKSIGWREQSIFDSSFMVGASNGLLKHLLSQTRRGRRGGDLKWFCSWAISTPVLLPRRHGRRGGCLT